MTCRAALRWVLAVALAATPLVGCATSSRPSSAPAPTVSTAAASPPPAPVVGSCHQLSFTAANQPVDDAPAVDCGGPHTTVTYAVGVLNQLREGHLLAVDADAVRAPLEKHCAAALQKFVGGTREQLRLSQLTSVWFTPSVDQGDAGANWFRCDVVALAKTDELAPLPRRMDKILTRGQAARFTSCGTTAPGKPGFAKVVCSAPHTWRADSVIELARDTPYQAAAATRAADQECKNIAIGYAGESLKYSWSFVWPSRERWDAGQRYGVCWVPR